MTAAGFFQHHNPPALAWRSVGRNAGPSGEC